MSGAAIQSRPFSPSIANNVSGAGPRQFAAVWALNAVVSLTASAVFVPAPAVAQIATPAIAVPLLSRPATVRGGARVRAPATTQDMVSELKAKGMPIAALSEVLGVERKTVYSWLDNGIEAKATNYDRLQAVHDLLADEANESLRLFHRFWDRKLPNGTSLKAALTSPGIDVDLVRSSLEALRPAVERTLRANAGRKAASSSASPASSLTLNLIVGT